VKALAVALLLAGCGGAVAPEPAPDDCTRVATYFSALERERCWLPRAPAPDTSDPSECWAAAWSLDSCYADPECAAAQRRTLAATCMGPVPDWTDT
jgi:hypothetical protein